MSIALEGLYKQSNDLDKMRRNLEEMKKLTEQQQNIARNAPGPNLDDLKRGSQQVTDTILERGQAHMPEQITPTTSTTPTPLTPPVTTQTEPTKKQNLSTPPASKAPKTTNVPKGLSKGKVVGGLAGAAALGGIAYGVNKLRKGDEEKVASLAMSGMYKEANEWVTPNGKPVTEKIDPYLMDLVREEQYFSDREMEAQRSHERLVDSTKRARRDNDFIVGSGVGALLGSAAGLKNKKNFLPGAVLGGMVGAPGGLVAGAALGRYKEDNVKKDPFVMRANDKVDYFYDRTQGVSDEILNHVDEKGYKVSSVAMSGLYKEAAPGFKMPGMDNLLAPKNLAPGKMTASPQPFNSSGGTMKPLQQNKNIQQPNIDTTPKPMQSKMNNISKPQGNNSSLTRLASVAMSGMYKSADGWLTESGEPVTLENDPRFFELWDGEADVYKEYQQASDNYSQVRGDTANEIVKKNMGIGASIGALGGLGIGTRLKT